MDGKSKVQTAELTPSWFCSTALPTEHASPHNDQLSIRHSGFSVH